MYILFLIISLESVCLCASESNTKDTTKRNSDRCSLEALEAGTLELYKNSPNIDALFNSALRKVEDLVNKGVCEPSAVENAAQFLCDSLCSLDESEKGFCVIGCARNCSLFKDDPYIAPCIQRDLQSSVKPRRKNMFRRFMPNKSNPSTQTKRLNSA